MGAVLSWFSTRLCALVPVAVDALKRWKVSKNLT